MFTGITGNAGQNDGILDEIDGCLARVPLCRDQRERFIALFDGASSLASRSPTASGSGPRLQFCH